MGQAVSVGVVIKPRYGSKKLPVANPKGPPEDEEWPPRMRTKLKLMRLRSTKEGQTPFKGQTHWQEQKGDKDWKAWR